MFACFVAVSCIDPLLLWCGGELMSSIFGFGSRWLLGVFMAAALTQTFDLHDLALRDEAHLGGGLLQQLVEARVLDFIRAPATPANQQDAVMVMAQMLAGRIGVAAFDFVQKAVFEKKLQSAIDGRRGDRLVLLAR